MFFAVLRCFLFNVLLCACGGGAVGREGLPAQPSPSPGEGPLTHKYRVTPTNYIYALYKETGEEKGCGEAEGQGVDVDVHSLFRLSFHKGLLSTCCVPGWPSKDVNRHRKGLVQSLPAVYLCAEVLGIVLSPEPAESRKTDRVSTILRECTSCALNQVVIVWTQCPQTVNYSEDIGIIQQAAKCSVMGAF